MNFICKFNQTTKGLFCFLILFAACLSSCNDDNLSSGSMADGGIEFRFNLPQTRVSIDEQTGIGSFENNDEVGLYADENGNHRYHLLTLQGEHWLPLLKPNDLGKTSVVLTALYPAPQIPAEAGIHDLTCTVQTDQSSKEGYQQSDLLGAQHELNLRNPGKEIPMTFRHLMHRLEITLTGIDTNDPSFAIAVYGRTQGKFNLSAKGTLQPDEASPEEWITPHKADDGSFIVLIAPQPVDIGKDRIRIMYNGKEYNYKFPENSVGGSATLVSGKETRITLNFKEDEKPTDIDFANKKFWIWGIERDGHPLPVYNENEAMYSYVGSPEKFPTGKWFYTLQDDRSVCYLSWQPDYGWYDCDKFNPEAGEDRPAPKDGRMCWAASASNALHWWMHHNREYIKLYDQTYPEDSVFLSLKRPSCEFNGKLGEDVFTFFRNTCQDKSGYAASGIDWFIRGNGVNVPYKNMQVAKFEGFFKHVFHKNDEIATIEKPLTKEKFNKIIKEAFETNQALTFSVATSGGHAMTIWGAEFDDTGTVSYLYYVDNNDYYQFEVIGGSSFQHHRIIRKSVRYDESEHISPILLGNIGKVYIMDVGLINLRQDVWKKWMDSLHQ